MIGLIKFRFPLALLLLALPFPASAELARSYCGLTEEKFIDQLNAIRTSLSCLDAHLQSEEGESGALCPAGLWNSHSQSSDILPRMNAQLTNFLASSPAHFSDRHKTSCDTWLIPFLQYKGCEAEAKLTTDLMQALTKPDPEAILILRGQKTTKGAPLNGPDYLRSKDGDLCKVLSQIANETTHAELRCGGENAVNMFSLQDGKQMSLIFGPGSISQKTPEALHGANTLTYESGMSAKKTWFVVNGALRHEFDFNPGTKLEADYRTARAIPALSAGIQCCQSRGQDPSCKRFTDFYWLQPTGSYQLKMHEGKPVKQSPLPAKNADSSH